MAGDIISAEVFLHNLTTAIVHPGENHTFKILLQFSILRKFFSQQGNMFGNRGRQFWACGSRLYAVASTRVQGWGGRAL